MADTRSFLKKKGHPCHIKDILIALGKESTINNIRSMSSQLNNYVRKDEIFTRPVPNTYGLIELDNENVIEELPITFGEN